MQIAGALSLIREIPDYPKPGIRFQDITPLLADGNAFFAVTQELATLAHGCNVVAGIEARGFIFASAVANQLKTGFVPIRKAGKLPFTTISEKYGLEYGIDTLEMHTDAIGAGSKVMLIDDVLASGGTIGAAIELVQRCGGEVIQVVALLEIKGLSGRETLNCKYPQIPITCLVLS